jgi:hypothetical protein
MQNLTLDSCFTVLEEKASDFPGKLTLDEYTLLIQKVFENTLTEEVFLDIRTTKVDSVDARQFEAYGVSSGIRLGYLVTTFVVNDTFYANYAWCSFETFPVNKSSFEAILTTATIN